MSYFAPKELLPQLILPQLLIVASFLISLSACQHVAVNVENRSCENHSDCNGTQICGPLQNLCAHILETDCDTSSNLCPSTISTGYYCGETGTLLPCSDSATDCSAGCRTCQDDGTWSECLGAECELGEAWSCSSCEDNCANSVINATAVCDKSQNPHQCSYEGSCYSGSVDTDSNKVNGCECTVQFSGLEQCNGEDDDCDGIIDDNAPCGIKLECIEGECRCTNTSCDDAEFCSETTKVCEACTDSDNDHCGPSCSVCTDSFRPVCVEGECSCTVGSCSDGLYCEINSNSCASCTNADSNHCGPSCLQCSGTQPNCSNGACVCTSTSCDSGYYCNGTSCVACTSSDPNHCGSSCLQCSGNQPNCSSGACVCTSTSCAGGDYCNDTSCAACTSTDDNHCGPSCLQCSGTQPNCSSGACVCTSTSCASGYYCNGTSCVACTSSDPNHCGSSCLVCSGEKPLCSGGSCICTNTSCGFGEYCDGSNCQTCSSTDDDHCGTACVDCSGTTPDCVGGGCDCVAGSCDAGQYCNNGNCTTCSCPALFPACTDNGANTYKCGCTSSSCRTQDSDAGSCGDSGTSCTFSDNFDSGSTLMALCPSSDLINSSWAHGSISYPSTWSCNSGTSCWGTNLGGNYNDCELSCIETPSFNLSGVRGSLNFSFKAKYDLESNYDGVTPRFWDGSSWRIITPNGGWDVAQVILGGSCSWTYVTWPAFGQYTTSNTIGWTTKTFELNSSTNSTFFDSLFKGRVYMESDQNSLDCGFYLDDLVIKITHN